jgi:hypothetical protein
MKGIKFRLVGKRGNDRRTAFPFHKSEIGRAGTGFIDGNMSSFDFWLDAVRLGSCEQARKAAKPKQQ